MSRIPRHGEIKFEFLPDQPPETKVGEWRARLAQNHWGSGPTIGEALDKLAAGIADELEAVKRARRSIAGKEAR